MTSQQAVTVDLADHVAIVEIHRPPHNWFDIDVITLLADSVLGLDDEPDCRAVVLCSEGEELLRGRRSERQRPPRQHRAFSTRRQHVFTNHKPIVALVQGAAVGGGLGLGVVSRLPCRHARNPLQLQLRAARLPPGLRHLGDVAGGRGAAARVLDLMYRAIDVRGEEALRIGLADRLAAADDLRAAALAFASEIAQSAPLALVSIRDTMRATSPSVCRS